MHKYTYYVDFIFDCEMFNKTQDNTPQNPNTNNQKNDSVIAIDSIGNTENSILNPNTLAENNQTSNTFDNTAGYIDMSTLPSANTIAQNTNTWTDQTFNFATTDALQPIVHEEAKEIQYNKHSKYVIITILFCLLSYIGYQYTNYINLSSKITLSIEEKDKLAGYKSYEDTRYTYFPKTATSYENMNLDDSQGSKKVDEITQSTLIGYVEKKDVLQTLVGKLMNSYISKTQRLDEIKQNTAKYGFFAQELATPFKDQEKVNGLQKSLLSLEVIKFSSAIKVFSYLDTFITGLTSYLRGQNETATIAQNTWDLMAQMDYIIQRGENDIYRYLQSCYLNPFEIDYTCGVVGDFDKYYRLITNETSLNASFFKSLMYYIDFRLEETDIPSFDIVFQWFDATKQQISFTIDVNTFLQDELALIQKWILNPHIFVVSNLLNFLKQSKLIIGSSIDARQLKIQPQTVQIWSSKFNINKSVMTFTLPLQRGTEREIFDFYETFPARFVPTNQTGSEPVPLQILTTGTTEQPVTIQDNTITEITSTQTTWSEIMHSVADLSGDTTITTTTETVTNTWVENTLNSWSLPGL